MGSIRYMITKPVLDVHHSLLLGPNSPPPGPNIGPAQPTPTPNYFFPRHRLVITHSSFIKSSVSCQIPTARVSLLRRHAHHSPPAVAFVNGRPVAHGRRARGGGGWRKGRGLLLLWPPASEPPQEYGYGTFQGPRHPPVGFPQPAPPPGFGGGGYHNQQQPYAPAEPYYAQGYQAVPGYGPVAEGRPVGLRTRRLPCCGLGLGWCLFITGFFLAAIPWYIGAFVLICVRVHDQREKPGYVACTIAAVVAALAILLGVTKGTHAW